ncbi:hypothetical protein K1T71_012480 [Dendrolimus kikuchii]|uniref:Uncharacterized protein n=1 Tax=Dendrolimus kikuchii TaxID=765133 RepID=A0ACC1CJP4_9NEOP|nr:hypothetical protein K1T71_012480 [Dendrolimus kikuchii]
MFVKLLCCLCSVYCLGNQYVNANLDDGPITTTPMGVFRGSWMETRRGRRFESYRGIKYAEPPINELRFQPPKPITRYNGIVNATDQGVVCPQPLPPRYTIDEDCLTINVYTPGRNRSSLLPVIFYLHPGGFYSMTGRTDFAGANYLADKDVVLVTSNYRLGSLGFLSLGTSYAPGNNGYRDQVVALKWVQTNIRAFGGDPNLVTIAGCSAGSVSVMLHMISPMSKGLFHRAISVSGSPTSKVPSPSNRLDLAYKQARIVNCPTNDTRALYDCLKTKTWKELAGSFEGFYEFGSDPLSLWRPVVEPDFGQERFLTMEPMDAIREGKMHAVPYLISMTKDEFFWKAFCKVFCFDMISQLRKAYLGDRELVNDNYTADRLGKLYGDSITAFPTHRLANLMCRHSSQPVYYYEFAYLGNQSHYRDPDTKKLLGVAHHDDLLYLFTLSYRYSTIEVSDSTDSKMVDFMTQIWYNFAKWGNPNGDPNANCGKLEISWPPMLPNNRRYLQIADELSIRENLFEDRFKIWEELYPIRY